MRRRRVLKLLLALGLLYPVAVGIAFLAQDQIMFPSFLASPSGTVPPGAERLEYRATDGTRLVAVRIPPRSRPNSETVLLVFGGSGHDAREVGGWVHDIYPDREVVAFYYRGYPPSGGASSAARLMEDSPPAYDFITSRLRPKHVVAVGISLGSGVASALAARRRLDGLILVTPFDSLRATAIQDHPWFPVASLLRHDIPSAALLRGTRQPVAILVSGRDRLVRAERTQALRGAIPSLVYDRTIPRARHHDIFFQPEFAPAMREALARIEAERRAD